MVTIIALDREDGDSVERRIYGEGGIIVHCITRLAGQGAGSPGGLYMF